MIALERFAAWLADGGAGHDALAVREIGGHRGVVAVRPIALGEVVAHVPRALLVTRDIVRGSSIGRQIRDAGLELANHAMFAAWLVTERRDARSAHRPYLDILPRALPRFPIHASGADLALLTGTLAGAMLDELRADLDDEYAKLQAQIRRFRPVERDEWTWARLCIGSRVFAIAIDGIATTAIVPFADLLDHAPGPNTSWDYDQDADAFTITAERSYAPGDEVHDSYGTKPNARLLVQYGFCLDDNPADAAELRFPTAGFRVPRDPEHPSSAAMLLWLRQQYPDEGHARIALGAAAQAGLGGIPSTEADDDALLARADLSPDARNFVIARRGERRVLETWVALAGTGALFGPAPAG